MWGKIPSCPRTARARWNLAPTNKVPAAGIEPAPSRLQRDARPSSCTGIIRASGGTRTHRFRFTGAAPGLSSITGIFSPSTLAPDLAYRVAGGSRTHTTPGHSRVPLPLWVRPQYPRQESNLHDLRLRRAACFRHTPGIFRQFWVSSGGWSRTNISGFRVRRPTIRRPRNK